MTKPTFIQPKEIEKALAELRQRSGTLGSNRPSLFNFVIYNKKNNREGYLNEIVDCLIKQYPCRILMITEDEEEKGDVLNTHVSEIKAKSNSSTPFICEVINFDVSPSMRDRIPFLIRPNLKRLRPVYVLWGVDPTEDDHLFKEIEKYATRTIFDSESVSHMSQFAKALLKNKDRFEGAIGDLNWARNSNWRHLIAHQFNTAQKLEELRNTREVNITYNPLSTKYFSHNKIQSVIFQAWLANTLGWEFETVLGTKEDLTIKYNYQDHPITIQLSPSSTNENVAPGRLMKVELHGNTSEYTIFERDRKDPKNIRIQRSTSAHCEIPVYHRLETSNMGRSIVREIYKRGTSEAYLNVLKLLASWKPGVVCS